MLRSALIATRGEIARRIIRTAKLLGVETIAVYSDIDEKFLFVQEADKALRIGEAKPKDSYLNIDKIIAVARVRRKCHSSRIWLLIRKVGICSEV